MQVALGQVGGAAPVGRQAEVSGQAFGAHAEHVERHRLRQGGQQVRAGVPGAPHGFVDDDGGAGEPAGVVVARVDDAVLDDLGAGGAAVPEESVEVGDVHDRQIGAVGARVAGVRYGAVGRVVLQVQRGHVAAGAPPAEPPLGQLDLVRALQQHQVDGRVAELLGGGLAHRGGPEEGAGPSEAVRVAARGDGDEVGVRALDERGRPGAVHMPQQDVHTVAPRSVCSPWSAGSSVRAATAASTSASPIASRQGCPGTGQWRARVSAHAACGSPSRRCGTP